MNTAPTTEERVWAILSHLSALAFGMGIILPIIGWSEQRRKSRYASLQCLQALGYQSLGYTIWLLITMIVFVLSLVVLVLVTTARGDNDVFNRSWAGIFIFVVFGLFGIYTLLPIVAAVACGLGKDFRYPLFGDRLAKYAGYTETNADERTGLIEAHEERWVTAMGHLSVIVPLWGILAPISAWVLQGRHSLFLKFQSLQTTAFQALMNGIYAMAMFIYFFGLTALFTMTGLEGSPDQFSPMGMAGFIIFLLSMLVTLAIFLIVPLFHILGQWAGYRVLKGENYRYPVVGRLVENWMTKKSVLKEMNP